MSFQGSKQNGNVPNKDLRSIAQAARKLGWQIEKAGKHWCFVHKTTGEKVICAGTPSSPGNSYRKTRRALGLV